MADKQAATAGSQRVGFLAEAFLPEFADSAEHLDVGLYIRGTVD